VLLSKYVEDKCRVYLMQRTTPINNFCFDITIYIIIELAELQLAVLRFCTVFFLPENTKLL